MRDLKLKLNCKDSYQQEKKSLNKCSLSQGINKQQRLKFIDFLLRKFLHLMSTQRKDLLSQAEAPPTKIASYIFPRDRRRDGFVADWMLQKFMI